MLLSLYPFKARPIGRKGHIKMSLKIKMSREDKKELKKIFGDVDFRSKINQNAIAAIWPDFVAGGKTAAGYMMIREKERYSDFIESNSGIFNGFDFVHLFHRDFRKENAIAILTDDDSANVDFNGKKYHVGIDGATVYFMADKPTKRVDFNRSVYFC